MDMPTSKELKKLALACRKAGISKFRHGDLEITLADEAPISNYRKSKGKISRNAPSTDVIDQNFQSDDLSQEQLLFYSVVDAVKTEESEAQ